MEKGENEPKTKDRDKYFVFKNIGEALGSYEPIKMKQIFAGGDY